MAKKKVEELTIEEKLNNAIIPVDKQPYRVPKNWCWVKTGSIFSVEYGKELSSKILIENGYPVFGANGQIGFYDRYMFEYPKALMGCRGTCGVMNLSLPKSFVTCNSLIIEGNNINISAKFIYYLYYALDLKKIITGSVQKQITISKLINFPVPLPPLAEQERIANKLDNYISKLYEVKEKLEKVVDTYNYRKNLILHRAFTGELTKNWRKENPDIESVDILLEKIKQEKENLKLNKTQKDKRFIKEEEIPYTIPNNWKWIKLKDIILYDVGGGTPSTQIDSYWNGNIPWMSVKDFANNKNGVIIDTIDHISEEGVKNSSTNIIDENAIILCVRMGLGKYAKLSRPMAINQDLRAIWLSKNINEKYFLHYYQTLKIIGRGTTVEGIKKDQLFAKFIPLPPIEEQKEIVKILDSILSKEKQVKEIAEKEIERTGNLRENLLTRAFAGMLGTNDPNEENSIELLKSVL